MVFSVLAAADKFKGSATAAAINAVIAAVARASACEATEVAVSDGGDGLLDVFGGPTTSTRVTGPLGAPVDAGWRYADGIAVIECALASGLALIGGAERNDAVAATSRGTGELLEAAVRAGAHRVVVGLGGSACTDGGLGAVAALSRSTELALLDDVELVVCCDVTTRYVDAAAVFGPQKGANPADVLVLADRLRGAARTLATRFGTDVTGIAGSGAAGGLGGALAAVGGRLQPGFDVVAEHLDLDAKIRAADLVITGEGRLDATSLQGKVVGGLAKRTHAARVPLVAIVGSAEPGLVVPFDVVSLTARDGRDRAFADVLGAVERAARDVLSRRRWA